jgi:hypothetical protein
MLYNKKTNITKRIVMNSGKPTNDFHISKVTHTDAQTVVRLGTVVLSTQAQIEDVAVDLEKIFFALIDENSQTRLDAKLCQLIDGRQSRFANVKKANPVESTVEGEGYGDDEGPLLQDSVDPTAEDKDNEVPRSDGSHSAQYSSFGGSRSQGVSASGRQRSRVSALQGLLSQEENTTPASSNTIADSKPNRWRRRFNKRHYFNDEKYRDVQAVDKDSKPKDEVGTMHLTDDAVNQLAAYLIGVKDYNEKVKKKYLGNKTVYISPRVLALRVAGFTAITSGAVPLFIDGGLSGVEALGGNSPAHMGGLLSMVVDGIIGASWAASNALGIRTDRGIEMLSHYRRVTIKAAIKRDEENKTEIKEDESNPSKVLASVIADAERRVDLPKSFAAPVGDRLVQESSTGDEVVNGGPASEEALPSNDPNVTKQKEFVAIDHDEQPPQPTIALKTQTTKINKEMNNLVYRAQLSGEESYVRKQAMVVAAFVGAGILLAVSAIFLAADVGTFSGTLWLRMGIGALVGAGIGATKYRMYKQQYEREAIAKHRRGDIDAALQKQLISRLSVYGLQPEVKFHVNGDPIKSEIITASSAGYKRQVEVDVERYIDKWLKKNSLKIVAGSFKKIIDEGIDKEKDVLADIACVDGELSTSLKMSFKGNVLVLDGREIDLKNHSSKERALFFKNRHENETYQGCSKYYEIEFLLQIRQKFLGEDPLLIAQEREQAFSKPVGKFFAEQEVKGAERLYKHIQMHKAVEKEAKGSGVTIGGALNVDGESPITVSAASVVDGEESVPLLGRNVSAELSAQQSKLHDLTMQALYKDYCHRIKLVGGGENECSLKEAMRVSLGFSSYMRWDCSRYLSTIPKNAEDRMLDAYFIKQCEEKKCEIVAEQEKKDYGVDDGNEYDNARKAWKKAQKEFTEINKKYLGLEKDLEKSIAASQEKVFNAIDNLTAAQTKLTTAKDEFKAASDKRPNKSHKHLFDAAVADPEKGDDYQAAYDAVSVGMRRSAVGTTATVAACAAYPAYGIAHGGGLAAVAQTEAGKEVVETVREGGFDTLFSFFVGRRNAANVQKAKNNNTQAKSGDLAANTELTDSVPKPK